MRKRETHNLTTTSGDVTLNIPRLKGATFEIAIIERYRRRESSVEEALIEKQGAMIIQQKYKNQKSGKIILSSIRQESEY